MSNSRNRSSNTPRWFMTKALVDLDKVKPSPYPLSTLTDDLKKRAQTIWPYLRICKMFEKQSEHEFIDGFRYDTCPEGEIFFWELFVRNAVDFFFIVSQRQINLSEYNDDIEIDAETFRVPLHKIEALKHNSVLQTVLSVNKKLLDEVYGSLMRLMNELGTDVPHSKLLRVAITRGNFAEEENAKAVAARKRKIYEKVFGYQCSQCKCFNREAKKCGRCRSVYYCDRECQVKHYPEHKKVCKPAQAKPSSSGKSA